jgi:hypothetical protein
MRPGMDGLARFRLVVGSSGRADRTSVDRTLGSFGVHVPESVFRKSLVINFDNIPETAIASVGEYRRNPPSN